MILAHTNEKPVLPEGFEFLPVKRSIVIKKEKENKEQYMDLLLEADPSKDMINDYLRDGELFVLTYKDDVACVAVVIKIDDETIELKNIATKEEYRGQGYGKKMLKYLADNYKQKYNKMLVGTSENNIPFYVKQGFDKYEKTIKNYFVDNYDEEIIDGDVHCIDMYYYHKMKLNESPFERIKNGMKTIEFRLYDEKRQQIKIGDQIEFLKLPDLQEKLLVDVVELYREDTFEKLFKKLYSDENEEEIIRKSKAMYKYYSLEKEKEYGVLGIKISLISNSFRYTYNKLVRDKIPENIDSEPGRKSQYRILNDNEYLTELNKKVLEEANEFIEENSIEELGDLMEVINAIMKLKGYKLEEVYKVMKDKADRKGVFEDRVYLEYVDEEKRNFEEEKELNKEFRK